MVGEERPVESGEIWLGGEETSHTSRRPVETKRIGQQPSIAARVTREVRGKVGIGDNSLFAVGERTSEGGG